MWMRVRSAVTGTVSMACACPSRTRCSTAVPTTSSSRMANFTAAPPAGTNSVRYSRSTTDSHSASGSGSVVRTSIGRFHDEADGVVVVLLACLIEQGQPPSTLAPSRPAEFEAASAAVGRVGLPIQTQQVGDELLLRI